MRCRPSLCQHLAAQLHNASPSSPLWITDDVLAEAFSRYARVSNACSQIKQRRFTSNVPGPLEARRRLARRRMGMQAVSAAPSAPGFDLGALFGLGLGSGPMLDPELNWKWEAPSLSDLGHGLGIGRPPAPPTLPLEQAEPSNTSAVQITRESAAAFESLLQSSFALDEEITPAGLSPLLHFLRSDQDDTAAHNIRSLCKKLMARSIRLSSAALDDFAMLIEDKLRLATLHETDFDSVVKALPTLVYQSECNDKHTRISSLYGDIWAAVMTTSSQENAMFGFGKARDTFYEAVKMGCQSLDTANILLSVLRSNARTFKRKHVVHWMQATLDAISEAHHVGATSLVNHQNVLSEIFDALGPYRLQRTICPITAHIARRTGARQDFGLLDMWLKALESCTCLPTRGPMTPVWKRVYYTLAQQHVWPSQVSRHFHTLPEKYVVKAIMRYWLPPLYLKSRAPTDMSEYLESYTTPSMTGEDATTKDTKVGVECQVYLNPNKLERDFRCHTVTYYTNWAGRQTAHPYVRLIAILERYKVDTVPLQNDMCKLLMGSRTPTELNDAYKFIKGLIDHPRVTVSTSAASKVLEALLEGSDLVKALRIFENVHTIPVERYPNLPVELVKTYQAPAHRIFGILLRRMPRTFYRQKLQSESFDERHTTNLSTSHIDIVERVATAYATQKKLPWRVSHRRVWECYRFLKDRGVDISPAISRALVCSSITRAIEEESTVVKGKFDFVLDMVRKAEGEEVATALNKLIFSLKQPDHVDLARTGGNLNWQARKSSWRPRPSVAARYGPWRWARHTWYNPRKLNMRRVVLKNVSRSEESVQT